MPWQILDTGPALPLENMAIDEDLLDSLDGSSHPILHLYQWKVPSATYGYFIKPSDHLDAQALQARHIHIARRSTGGGIIFHEFDFAFSVLIPASHRGYSINTLDNYALINNVIAKAVAKFSGDNKPVLLPKEAESLQGAYRNFCMAKPTKFDVMLNGRKIAGGAQRRTKQGFLHQGSIALTVPSNEYFLDILLQGSEIYEAMLNHSAPLLGMDGCQDKLENARQTLKRLLIEEFRGL